MRKYATSRVVKTSERVGWTSDFITGTSEGLRTAEY